MTATALAEAEAAGRMNANQIPLALPVESAQTRDDLIVSIANARAVELLDSWPDWPGNLVVLTGPPGSGKSHMAAAWSVESGATVTAMRELSIDDPPATANLLLEDAEAGGVDEHALFHVLNHIKAQSGYCLITGRTTPSAWRLSLPDLVSRLKAAQVVALSEPDDALLRQVIFKLFADRQLILEPGVIDYIVRRMERSLDAARILVERIDREALARNARISRRIAASALRGLGMA
jgi:chromosomal replication initiation ATPase DnaA